MKSIKRIITLLLTLSLVFTISGCKEKEVVEENKKVEEIFERVFDAGTYTELDYEYAKEYFANTYDQWNQDLAGCSAIAKTISNGDTIVGRNMDLTISNKAAYVYRTKVEGCYETISLTYTFRKVSPDYDDVIENGLSPEFQKILPFLADDVLNSEGLYIEVNMRNGETWPTGETKFGCDGTNKDSKERVYLFELPRYVGEHCATVDEAVEYIKTLDLYSMFGNEINAHNYCFIMADATGHYGLVEFAANQVYWHDYQNAQANFYIAEDLYKIQELKAGVGRYEYLQEHIDEVDSEEQMASLMNDVTYYQAYFPNICKFDNRSEFIGLLPYWTYDYVMNEINKDNLELLVGIFGEYLNSISYKQKQDANEYWETIFLEVINCNNKTLTVKFYEDDSRILKLSFDE